MSQKNLSVDCCRILLKISCINPKVCSRKIVHYCTRRESWSFLACGVMTARRSRAVILSTPGPFNFPVEYSILFFSIPGPKVRWKLIENRLMRKKSLQRLLQIIIVCFLLSVHAYAAPSRAAFANASRRRAFAGRREQKKKINAPQQRISNQCRLQFLQDNFTHSHTIKKQFHPAVLYTCNRD